MVDPVVSDIFLFTGVGVDKVSGKLNRHSSLLLQLCNLLKRFSKIFLSIRKHLFDRVQSIRQFVKSSVGYPSLENMKGDHWCKGWMLPKNVVVNDLQPQSLPTNRT
jgi:hypothetical protein